MEKIENCRRNDSLKALSGLQLAAAVGRTGSFSGAAEASDPARSLRLEADAHPRTLRPCIPVPAALLVLLSEPRGSSPLERCLAEHYAVECVSDGEAMLVAAMARHPDVVLAAAAPLGRRNFECLRMFKRGGSTSGIPVILLAESADDALLAEGLAAGADDFLLMSQTPSEVRRRVDLQCAAGRARREAEAYGRVLMEELDDGVCIVQDQRFVSANRVLPALLGYPVQGFAGLACGAVIAPEHRERWSECCRRALAGKVPDSGPAVMNFLCRSGERLSLEFRGRRVRLNGREALLCILRDTSLIERLEADQLRLLRMIDASRDFIGLIEPDGHLIYINRAGRRMLGVLDPDDIVPTPLRDHLAPEARERVPEEGFAAALKHGAWTGESVLLARDGQEIPVSQMILAHRGADGSLEYFSTVARDLSERIRAERILREADRRRDDFVAMLGHELRNPLAPIRNAVRVLRNPELGEPELSWAREVIDRQVAHMGRLLDDLLDLSHLARGSVSLQAELLDLNDAVRRAVDICRPLIQFRGHTLDLALAAEPLGVAGELARLVQVVSNLLDNAARYTGRGGRIEVATEGLAGEARIRVRDNGTGIAADLLPHVFEPFTQAERPLDRSQGGLGLGLALVRRLTELHGGRVEAHSGGLGRGAEFSVVLPRLSLSAPAPEPASGGAGTPKRSQTVRVLVVDDNIDSANSMALLLSLDGHDVRTAFDGPGALAEAEDFLPEAVFLDIGLPGMDGYEVASHMRRLPGMQHTLMVAITGYGQDEDRARSREAGFDHHLVKPVDPEILSALLSSLPRA